jgi:hypothetical protein
MFIKQVVIFSIALTSWAFVFPEQALALLAELKRQQRLRVIHRTGMEAAKDVKRNLHHYASQHGIEKELVEEVLAEHHDLIVDRLGEKYAREILGEPDPTERNS